MMSLGLTIVTNLWRVDRASLTDSLVLSGTEGPGEGYAATRRFRG